MIKKLFLTIFLALPLIASAQLGAGVWKSHSFFIDGNPKNCIDVGSKVYYLNSGSLYCYNKEAQTNEVLDVNTVLNSQNISQIYYNYDKQYLVVAYKDCNIDIILSTGEVVNVPAIKEVIMRNEKVINDVTFGASNIYVATSFGYIVVDADTFGVKEVRNFETDVTSVAQVGNIKVMSIAGRFYYCDIDDNVETVVAHRSVANAKGKGRIYPINDSKFFLSCSSSFQIVTIGHGTDSLGVDTCNFTLKQVVGAAPTTVQPYPAGFVASFFTKNYYYTILPDASKSTKVAVTVKEIYTSQEEGNWWVLGTDGLAHVVAGVKGEYFKPDGISIAANAYWTTYDPYKQRVILCRTTDNFVLPSANSGAKTEINAYDGVKWTNITPANAPSLAGNLKIMVSPNEPDTYFYSTRTTGGICKVTGDSVRVIYDSNNSPFVYRAMLDFDSKGNLWMPQSKLNTGVMVITPENQMLDEVNAGNFVMSDFGEHALPENSSYFKRQVFAIGAGDTKVYAVGEWNFPVYIWNNNEDLSVNKFKAFNSFSDQDNKDFSAWGYIDFKADNDSIIWAATVSGVISFDPREAFNEDFKINRVTFTKNQGIVQTGVLCEGLQVNCIDVDANNNKWIATNASGVYFVSPDGSEIYKHFDSSNSPMTSDQVYSVCCNRATGSVIIVTPSGVVEYFSDITPAASDYSDVYVYPNPVEPDFTGLITINGLMASSNVVITDDDGNIVKTMVSDGGIALWDGCDSNGARVKTGNYKVYASQGQTDITTEPMAKIAIIK